MLKLRQLQSLWNPFRDWNESICDENDLDVELQSLWNPFRDWNLSQQSIGIRAIATKCFKASETLLGIETDLQTKSVIAAMFAGFKASETLLGIETVVTTPYDPRTFAASKPLKPF